MPKELSISVALCTHNGATFVAEQVQSILSQTRLPREIVLSDDASTDDTVAIVRNELAAFNKGRPKPIELIVRENKPALGVTKNFEQAIRLCTSDLVALSDQDDVWLPHKLERMASEFDARPDLTLLHANLKLVDAQIDSLGADMFTAYRVSPWEFESIHAGRAIDVLVRRNLVTGASSMFRRKLLDLAEPLPEAWVHDEWLGIVASVSGRVDVLEEPLVLYRQHGGNQIGAAKMNLRHYIGRMIFSRTERNARLLARATQMAEHPVFVTRPEMKEIALDKLGHETARWNFPASRLRRLGPVLRERRTGRYRRFGLGFQDIARDLIQPS
jgi:glycosyltransferase involved in cell wall biosynthesis